MIKATVGIDTMVCAMCEAHVAEAIRRAINVKKVTASHKSGKVVIIAEKVGENAVRAALADTGYRVTDYIEEPYEKKKIFSFFGKK